MCVLKCAYGWCQTVLVYGYVLMYGERVVACSVTCTFALRMHAEEDNEEGGSIFQQL